MSQVQMSAQNRNCATCANWSGCSYKSGISVKYDSLEKARCMANTSMVVGGAHSCSHWEAK